MTASTLTARLRGAGEFVDRVCFTIIAIIEQLGVFFLHRLAPHFHQVVNQSSHRAWDRRQNTLRFRNQTLQVAIRSIDFMATKCTMNNYRLWASIGYIYDQFCFQHVLIYRYCGRVEIRGLTQDWCWVILLVQWGNQRWTSRRWSSGCSICTFAQHSAVWPT
jgi:hypothetical protein